MTSTSSPSAWVRRQGLALLTDWYELTMMGGYYHAGHGQTPACFEYFFRELPPHNGFAALAGLEAFLDFYETLSFSPDDIAYLRSTGAFDANFLDSLSQFKPQCDAWAIPEGTVVFPYEPLIRVEGPLFEAQLLETFLLNAMNYPTLVATKAARICAVASPDPVIEFGLRRAQGPDGGLIGSRAAYIGGCEGSSNVLAGKYFGIPVRGTHAHSWVMSFPSELEAFRAYVKAYPQTPILLVDTYDTLASGVPNAIRVFSEMKKAGNPQRVAIRLDSGDLARLSKAAYDMITSAGFDDPLIVASNELDEDLIADLKRQGAKINSWGVGTKLITAGESPALTGIYKLVALHDGKAWQPKVKLSSNPAKATDPGIKRPIRYFDADGKPLGDVLYLDNASPRHAPRPQGRGYELHKPAEAGSTPAATGGDITAIDRQHFHLKRHLQGIASQEDLLQPVVRSGQRLAPAEPLDDIRSRARRQIASLPDELKRLRNPEIYPVVLSADLAKLKEEMLKGGLGAGF
jgi:nicotinate phosphoribosyltransferase